MHSRQKRNPTFDLLSEMRYPIGMDIDDLAPNLKNPRKITSAAKKGLSRSLEKFGDLSGITFNSRTDQLVCGHQRLTELKAMGGEYRNGAIWVGSREYRVRVVDWDEATEREANVAANNNHISGDWDDTIADCIREIQAGMSDEEFSELRFDALADDLKIDLDPIGDDGDEPVPEPPVDPVTKPGDVWILGDHVLVCGDSTDTGAVAPALALKPFIMVTDPPYGVEYDPCWREKTNKFGPSKLETVTNDDRSQWGAAYRLFPGGVAYVWHASLFVRDVLNDLFDAGMLQRAMVIWRKQHFVFGRGHYHWQHEPCVYAVRKGQTAKWCGDRTQSTMWDIENHNPMGGKQDDTDTKHSTQKPLECMARPIRNHGKAEDAVYDPFLGSGTTLIAAEKLGRRCGGLEIDPGYCDVIIERWEQLTGGSAVRK